MLGISRVRALVQRLVRTTSVVVVVVESVVVLSIGSSERIPEPSGDFPCWGTGTNVEATDSVRSEADD